jgi:hypothetical protein
VRKVLASLANDSQQATWKAALALASDSMKSSFSMSDQNKIPVEYLTEIGRISVEWSVLESLFDLSLMKLAGLRAVRWQ